MFAGSCIGVLLLVVALEALRRASREYDAYIARSHQQKATSSPPSTARLEEANGPNNKASSTQSTSPLLQPQTTFTPNVFQQLVRAFLHRGYYYRDPYPPTVRNKGPLYNACRDWLLLF